MKTIYIGHFATIATGLDAKGNTVDTTLNNEATPRFSVVASGFASVAESCRAALAVQLEKDGVMPKGDFFSFEWGEWNDEGLGKMSLTGSATWNHVEVGQVVVVSYVGP